MSRISDAFKNGKVFIPFITGGDPDIETSYEIIKTMAANGADIIEIGIPFSDPIAEGPVIQEADVRALNAGTTTDKLFDLVVRLRKEIDIPLIFMTYMNPIYVYGTERFLEKCREIGIDNFLIDIGNRAVVFLLTLDFRFYLSPERFQLRNESHVFATFLEVSPIDTEEVCQIFGCKLYIHVDTESLELSGQLDLSDD